MANSSTPFIQRLFVYRLMLIQFQFLIPVSPLMVADWSLWFNMNAFKCDYIACTLASMVSTFFQLQHARFTWSSPDLTLPGYTPLYSCMSPKTFKLADKCGRSLPHKWYLDIQAHTTIPDSHDHLYDRYVCSPSTTPVISLVPGVTTNQKNRHWLISLDDNAAPLFGCEAHVPFPAVDKYTTVAPRCTFTVSLLKSLIFPTNCARIRQTTMEVVSSYFWANLCDVVTSYCNRLSIPLDFSSSLPEVIGDAASLLPLCDPPGLPFPIVLPPGSHYRFYTDGSLINLGSPDVSMGWLWVQIIPDAGYLNSVATYAHGTIRNWPSSTRAKAVAIYAALSATPEDSVISIYTDSQTAIDGLRSCVSSTYTNSRFYYKTTNFELWAFIECCIYEKRLTVLSVKVKGHDGNYWNEFAYSLANSAHQSDDVFLLPNALIASSHSIRLIYDDIICESNPRRLFKVYYQATYMRYLLSLRRFQFTFCLTDQDDYLVDWNLTWFTLNFLPSYNASFQAHHASRHYTFKFKLFLDDLPLLEKLKITRPDLYIDLLTCRSCCNCKEDLMHLILCSKRRNVMHQILQSYQNHLFSKLREAGELADMDSTPMLRRLSSLSCWNISSSNWSSYALIQEYLPKLFIDLFVELSILRQSAMKVVAAIHNNFVQKLRKRI
ncbi:hypothetical protein RclHR1_20250009 [Rhizophagus clarus]|uniref:RNase H type-1 domain-containing protein n=1 Tax=Rhizophagus clarus TaxID=94130 RepID=A0A2Z6R6I0_9GLOM|nr:hypothetical protein RclHR1_20250009 [Rhizophagus clarus]